MFIGAYHFEGESDVLLEAHQRLMVTYPPEMIDLHACVATDQGLTVYDACPSASEFTAFSTSAEFAEALRAAGLPAPRVEALGDVHYARLRQPVG